MDLHLSVDDPTDDFPTPDEDDAYEWAYEEMERRHLERQADLTDSSQRLEAGPASGKVGPAHQDLDESTYYADGDYDW